MSRAILEDKRKIGRTDNPVDLPKYFLWSKIGTESGESLETIIRRKEIEREACNGIFYWGVGSSVGTSLLTLRRLSENSPAVFSRMRSKAKSVDVEPSRLVLWLGYEDVDGIRQPLPVYSFVTSRDSGNCGANRRAHYALMCESSDQIDEDPVGEVDATVLVNIRSGKRVGYSQVTSVVARNGSAAEEPMLYPVTFTANLIGPGQVRLTDAVEISEADVTRVAASAEEGSLLAWKRAVADVKRKIVSHSFKANTSNEYPAQLDMLETA